MPDVRRLDPRDLTTFLQAEALIIEFEKMLLKYGIRIQPGSELELLCHYILELEEKRLKKAHANPMEDLRILFRKSIGLLELVRIMMRVEARYGLSQYIPHLHLLNSASVPQNVPKFSHQGSNKLFELLMGMICLPVGEDVKLDDPNRARGDNPDILFRHGERKWGIACKVVNGQSPLTMYERWEEGIVQIENSEADVGIVIFNMKNVIDHDLTWPILNREAYDAGTEEPFYGSWMNEEPVGGYLQNIGNLVHTQFEDVNSREMIDRAIAGKKAIPGLMLFLQTTSSIVTNVGPMATTVGVLSLTPYGSVNQDDFAVLRQMNEVLHNRL